MNRNEKILIFTDEISTRLVYTLSIVLKSRDIWYELTNDPIVFTNAHQPKLVYSNRPFNEEYLTLSPAELLFEENVMPKKLEKDHWFGEEILSINNELDPLASVFYVITCYEEYTHTNRDMHNRFQAKDSILYKFNWLEKLIVERWSLAFIQFIEKGLKIKLNITQPAYQLIPTFDIDHAFAYKNKSKLRRSLGTLKDAIYFKKERIRERKAVVHGKKDDPFDTYSKMVAFSNKGFPVYVFWLLGDFGTYDKNIHFDNPHQKKLIQELSKKVTIGLHPSYKSNEILSQLAIEKKRLSTIIGEEVSISRQHFLKIDFPYTYKHLIKNGFTDDFSLGFVDHVGFRAGIARSFNWFNLTSNSEEDLVIHPIAYMDGTLKDYMKLNIEEAMTKISQLKKEVKEYGGDFVFIWHNNTIGKDPAWSAWSKLLNYTINND